MSNIPSSTRCPPGQHFHIRLQRWLYQWKTHSNPMTGAESLPLFYSTQNQSHDTVSITDQERFWPPGTSSQRAEEDLKEPLIPVSSCLNFPPSISISGYTILIVAWARSLTIYYLILQLWLRKIFLIWTLNCHLVVSICHSLPLTCIPVHHCCSLFSEHSITGSFTALNMTWSPLSLCLYHWIKFDVENAIQNWMYFNYDLEQCAHVFINLWIFEHVFVLETWSSVRQEWTRHKFT